jgi:hypothetical protein
VRIREVIVDASDEEKEVGFKGDLRKGISLPLIHKDPAKMAMFLEQFQEDGF